MSVRYNSLHSHSGLERDLKIDKGLVIIDEEYKSLFEEYSLKPFKYNGLTYYKVPTLAFVNKGGVFKNFAQ